jgi:hypothetical protein
MSAIIPEQPAINALFINIGFYPGLLNLNLKF